MLVITEIFPWSVINSTDVLGGMAEELLVKQISVFPTVLRFKCLIEALLASVLVLDAEFGHIAQEP